MRWVLKVPLSERSYALFDSNNRFALGSLWTEYDSMHSVRRTCQLGNFRLVASRLSWSSLYEYNAMQRYGELHRRKEYGFRITR